MKRLVWLVVPVALAVYLLTMYPSIGMIDAGELATACRFLNIAHPTGYPLYTMIGRLATLVPIGAVINRVTALSAFLGAAGLGLFLWLLLRMRLHWAIAGGTTAVLAFAPPVWSVCIDVEVYALALLLVGVLWLAAERAEDDRLLLFLAFAAGLALTNHMAAISAIAGAGAATLVARGRSLRRRLPVLVLLFLLGLTPYLYLLLRARAGPLMAWGGTVDLERFWWHVTGKQYRVWMFSLPFREVLANAGKGLGFIARSFLFVLLVPVLLGARRLWRERRGLAVGLALAAVLSFGYAVNYQIPDIEAYYIPCLLALGVFCAVGLDGLVGRLARRPGRARLAQLAWLPGIAALVLNYGVTDRHDDYVHLDQAQNVLLSAKQDATVIELHWDVYSPLLYLQSVEGIRPDVCIIDRELVRRSWYLEYLERTHPWLIANSRVELARYLSYLDQFEHGTLRDARGIQEAFIGLLESFVENNPSRPAYLDFPRDMDVDSRQLFRDRSWVPVGFLFELRRDSVVPEFDYSRVRVRVPSRRLDDRTKSNLLNRYEFYARHRFAYLRTQGRPAEAQAVHDWYERELSVLR